MICPLTWSCACTHTNTYNHTHISQHIHTYTHTHIHTYTHAHVHTYTHVHIHTNTHTHIHTYTHTHKHTYTHTHIHRYTHAQTRAAPAQIFTHILQQCSFFHSFDFRCEGEEYVIFHFVPDCVGAAPLFLGVCEIEIGSQTYFLTQFCYTRKFGGVVNIEKN